MVGRKLGAISRTRRTALKTKRRSFARWDIVTYVVVGLALAGYFAMRSSLPSTSYSFQPVLEGQVAVDEVGRGLLTLAPLPVGSGGSTLTVQIAFATYQDAKVVQADQALVSRLRGVLTEYLWGVNVINAQTSSETKQTVLQQIVIRVGTVLRDKGIIGTKIVAIE